MRIALTGVSGLIGSAIARHASEAGHSITGLVRQTSRRDHIEPFVDRFIVGTQDDDSVWPDLLADADCVIHNSVDWSFFKEDPPDLSGHLRSNVEASIRLLDQSGPRQFIYISSVAVHHHMLPSFKGVITEDHPCRPGSLYGAYKAAVEAHLWPAAAQGRNVCAIRPCAVYGVDPNLTRSIGHPIVEKIRNGERYERAGGGKFVHIDDVAQAIVACVGRDDVAGRTFTLADCYARWGDLAQMIAAILGVDADIDLSSPETSANRFTKDAAQSIGIDLDRGWDGLRDYLCELIAVMDEVPASA